MNEYNLKITGITCSACVKLCSMILKKIGSVRMVDIQEDGTTVIRTSEPLDINIAISALQSKGYSAITQ